MQIDVANPSMIHFLGVYIYIWFLVLDLPHQSCYLATWTRTTNVLVARRSLPLVQQLLAALPAK